MSLPRRNESIRSGDIVHIIIHQMMNGEWLTGCNEGLRTEDSDYVECMPNADFVDEPANCMACIVGADRWDEDGVFIPGREYG